MAAKLKKSINGVDISYCQTGLDYEKMKNEGVGFALIRVGYTGTKSHKQRTDTMLSKHVKGCAAAGILYGYYWYSAARTVEEAKREARYCAAIIRKYDAPSYPVFFDMEEPQIAEGGTTATTDLCLAFIKEMNEQGYPSGVYTNPDWLEHKLEKKRLMGKVDIWLAHWTQFCSCTYGQSIWQCGLRYSAGKRIDYDVCYVDYPKYTARWYEKHGKSKLKPVPAVAQEVIAGKWGNGAVRKSRLTAAGYDYAEVQAAVNSTLAAKKK